MKKIILFIFITLFFTACEEPGKEEIIHTSLKVENAESLALNKTDLIGELKKVTAYDSTDYDESTTYVVFRFWVDKYVGIVVNFNLQCGAKKRIKWYFDGQNIEIKEGFETGALAVFSKQDLDEHNCLQADGQLEDLTGSLYGYSEYTRNRTTPVKLTVTSSSITYTAQEINEAFALFNE